MNPQRRRFLGKVGALTSVGLAANLDVLTVANAHAQAASDYKALVCIFLFGGNDANNTLIPADTAGYSDYSKIRGPSSGISIAQNTLLQINPPGLGRPYGLHPELGPFKNLFDTGKLAVLANVGTLIQPTTRADFQAGRWRPDNLFSHSDQQNEWQSGIASGLSRSGWGGRIADKMGAINGALPVATSIAGNQLMLTGNTADPLTLPSIGGFALSGFNGSAAANARLQSLKELLTFNEHSLHVASASKITGDAINLSGPINSVVNNPNSSVTPLFANVNTSSGSIGAQLLQVAKLIEGRALTGAKRQLFFVSQGGYDTHNGQIDAHNSLYRQLGLSVQAFYDATVQLGVANQVTSFTLSDFGRTMNPSAGLGTDHGWGAHHFIIGGAVKGGNFYGKYPTLALAGPDDATNQGRWIPTTSVDQYAATLATWFGVAPSDLRYVLPNIGNFPTSNLGFMA